MSGQEHGENAAPLGHALREAREARGLSDVQIGEAINLRATVVRAIESDDFTLCGGDVYARGHVRAYAKQVGLDAAPLLDAYAQRKGVQAPPPVRTTGPVDRPLTGPIPTNRPGRSGQPTVVPDGAVPPTGPIAARPTLRRAPGWSSKERPLERSGPNRALIVGAALAVLLVFLLVQVIGDLRSPGRGTTQVASPSVSVPAGQAGEPTPSPTPSATSTSTGEPTSTSSPTSTKPSNAAGVAVAMNVTGDSWVSVRDASGKSVFSGLLVKGDKRKFSDGKGLRLTLGNAGGVRLTVNGKPLGAAGAEGQVVRLKFGPDDPA
ncbi:helix-turn-helix domain-containing protein [Angustibacter luteus]|uniref:Helix-turn-helix domain-containing protein n=1 Tax=Angustibacter luteus TaxID=658456 RepID=A0ABW1J8D7_9ACTN